MRKYIIAGSLAIATLIFSSCGAVPDGTISWEQQSADSIVIENNHVKGELVENTVNIDANVSGLDSKEWKEYTAALKRIDEEEASKISHILLGENIYLKEKHENNVAKDDSFSYSYSSNDTTSYVSIASGRIYFNTPKNIELQYVSFFRNNGSTIDEKNLKELFPVENIEGLDKESAVLQFKKTCNDLSIDISDNINVYAFDKDSANTIREENEWLAMDKKGEKKPDITYEDEAYFIIAPLQVKGVELPVSDTSSNTGSSYTSVVYSVIGRNGMYHFSASGLYNINDEKEVSDIHNINEVLDYIKTNYQYLEGQNQSIVISDITLQYIARYYVTDNVYKIVPTYVCTKDTTTISEKEGERYEKVKTGYLYIDAQNLTSFSG